MSAWLQAAVVAWVVAAAFVYAAWSLMPRRWRNRLATSLRRVPGLQHWSALQPKAQAGCSGCDGACAPAAPKAAATVKFYRRTPP